VRCGVWKRRAAPRRLTQRASIQPGRDFRLGLETYAESVVYTWLRLLDEVLRMTSPTKSHTIVAGGEET
jgi:hypothetical protein